ncbi:3-hydroxyacyl-CoA dehydrogenase NAD-binding domain-containing protein [Qingshengfaniella alkalisoli]|uniref:3-hydroxybutyryl-CoA dehydrogenase n=1 Tax=Qingshengfaniella alkalisoli TaxID=2599296 RepID=A0A5B8J185_9RHOB|nr:3-hydroxyacyl-CoA dehydrogenase NAD-binding domain-containing protein [Qingshengfaniella alkalisoli]QDY70638.1 3-hydroxybutyryl-CoA dehydrogenase [Qingshengfaniella alkalisoli]
MERIVVIGAGTMGLRICRHFIRASHPVALVDPSAEALEKAQEFFSGTHHGPSLHSSLQDLPQHWRDAGIIIEAVPENLDLKRRIIADLELYFDESTTIASNTSGLRTAELTAGMIYPDRFVITHFFNPADLIPAVEVVPSDATSTETVERITRILETSGKKVARLAADIPGFIANRLQHAMLRECFHLIDSGVADAETIDIVTQYSLGVRLALIGPLLQRDLNGLDIHLNIARYLYPDLDAHQEPATCLVKKVDNGDLGRKTGRGFYEWDDAQREKIERIEHLLPTLVNMASLSQDGENETNEENSPCQNG